MTGPRLRLASALGVFAALAVLGATAVTVSAYTRHESAPTSPGHALAGGQHVTRGAVVLEVPARDWTLEGEDTVLYYLDRSGRPGVGVAGPAVFRVGFCRREPDGSNRGFIGVAGSTPGSAVRAANVAVARDWAAAVALGADLQTSGPRTRLRTAPVTLDDGTRAVWTSALVTVPDPVRCEAPAVDLTLLSFATAGTVTHVVLVRDAGVPGTLPDAAAERILRTVHPRSG
ncbi:MAG TPA: hypothetical protein VFT00_01335 [Nocardioides sp.]|nr:hypothetical protein [Nocardioides sp.]